MATKRVLHLPDCQRVTSVFTKPCDCGQPKHPLPPNYELVRIKRGKRKGRMVAQRRVAQPRKKK